MIRCNLAILLAERGVKISRVASDTGISRTTLTALSNNYSQGVQFDTLNTLCAHLNTTPDKIIAYYPIDFKIKYIREQGIANYEDLEAEIKLDIVENKRSTSCYLLANVTCFYDENCPCFKISVRSVEPDNIDVFEGNTDAFFKALDNLPISFRKDLEAYIFKEISNIWPEHHEPVLSSFSWSL